MREEHVYFRSGSLMLEGVLHWPEGDGPFPSAVVCHPHPLYGGDMDNNVVVPVAQTLAKVGVVAIRFNFRGVGNSEGSYDDGAGEQQDASAAIDFLHSQPQVDVNRTAMIGYSFGSYAGLMAALGDERVAAVAAISPPLSMFDYSFLQREHRPKLLVTGQRDEFTPPDEFVAWAKTIPEPKTAEVIALATHFWLGHEQRLADWVAVFLKPHLGL